MVICLFWNRIAGYAQNDSSGVLSLSLEQTRLSAVTKYNEFVATRLQLKHGRITNYSFINSNLVFSDTCKFKFFNTYKNGHFTLHYFYQLTTHERPLNLVLTDNGIVNIVDDVNDFNCFVSSLDTVLDNYHLSIFYLLLTEGNFSFNKILLHDSDFTIFEQERGNNFGFSKFCRSPESLSQFKIYKSISKKIQPFVSKKVIRIFMLSDSLLINQYTFYFRRGILTKVTKRFVFDLKKS